MVALAVNVIRASVPIINLRKNQYNLHGGYKKWSSSHLWSRDGLINLDLMQMGRLMSRLKCFQCDELRKVFTALNFLLSVQILHSNEQGCKGFWGNTAQFYTRTCASLCLEDETYCLLGLFHNTLCISNTWVNTAWEWNGFHSLREDMKLLFYYTTDERINGAHLHPFFIWARVMWNLCRGCVT